MIACDPAQGGTATATGRVNAPKPAVSRDVRLLILEEVSYG
jgi:hypothetical protein